MRALGLAVGLLAALLPWTAAVRVAPVATPGAAILETPLYVFVAALLALGGAALTRGDRWLGLLVLWGALGAVAARDWIALATALWLAGGAAVLVAARGAVERGAGPILRVLLVATAAGEALYALGQAFRWDPLWWGSEAPPYVVWHGTLGNPKYLGAFLALLAPLAPLAVLPILLVGVVLSRSWLAAAAVIVGLALRPSGSRRARAGALALGVLGALGAVWARGWSPDSLLNRLAVWRLAWDDLWAVPVTLLTGYGPGAWPQAITARQIVAAGQGWPPELFAAAHSDLVRLGFEGGALALAVLGLWILAHRAAWWRSPWRGAAAALAVLVVGLHPMHLASIAVPACVVLGAATART